MTRDRNALSGDEGFTFVELLVVCIIIGVLSAIAIPTLAAQTGKARTASVRSALRDAVHAEEELAADDQPYAVPGAAGLTALLGQGLRLSETIVITVIDDAMAGDGGGYCLKAESTSLGTGKELYYASTGANAGRITSTECTES
jgi:prepilin-type N-terminal cleavage/methylation domain-containing protein